MPTETIHRIATLAAYHQLAGLPKPAHPLISVVRFEDIKPKRLEQPKSIVNNFYSIALKWNFTGRMYYGQQPYDFDEGVMVFLAPGQVLSVRADELHEHTGWLLMIHPDFLWHTPLAKGIRQYDYFNYSIREALFLSETEESTIVGIIQQIQREYQGPIDKFSQNIIIAQLEVLLNYADRYYQRQFITRRIINHELLDRFEAALETYIVGGELLKTGLPTVGYMAEQLSLSPTYLSNLMKTITGQSPQQHIHDRLIKQAKELLSTSTLSVSEIAYELGFGHPQSFSKLFKSKTSSSPLEFRHSFN
ncbi:helix-turn-helix domain-containing protein [Spirosoma sp. KUDC1026]|uniref:helix-turn-helix domain-containing protein n=1 Tax=Spirosoma sp. KUDC1026 TaxID=2745947 RepID=UPI00159BEF04|nr:response regulator transcription factor [Spirosoma sp. KUDC1026]QKZ13564.1 helix-turn-helix transcriptional regulator [Spirosoma sp. KUDC1026]